MTHKGYTTQKTYEVNYFRNLEEKLIAEQFVKSSSNRLMPLKEYTDQELNNAFKSVHSKMINTLISFYMSKMCLDYLECDFSHYFEGELEILDIIPSEIELQSIPQICESLHIAYLNSLYSYKNGRITRKKSKANLLETGAVYTQDKIAHDIVYHTLANVEIEDVSQIKILDFATGTGRFYKQIIVCLKELLGIIPEHSIINNIYAVDIDPIAINICRLYALSQIGNLNINKATIVAKHIILKNALLREDLFESRMAINHNDFDGLFSNGFHAIVSNPPYLVLKPNKKKMDAVTIENINKMVTYFRTSSYYKYSVEGMLNLYQLSIEAMLGMLKRDGELGVICPSTLFADISASSLRKYLLSKNNVTYIKYFSEDDPLFDNVTQATCIFHLRKGTSTNDIKIVQGIKKYNISLLNVKEIFKANWEIPSIEKIEWDILNKLQYIPLLKTKSFIRNKRGELDLSLYKDYITLQKTDLRLIRGNMLSGDTINDINHEYVKPEFLDIKTKDYLTFDYNKRRIVCQQISNQTQKIRLKFIECQKNDILGNSCNYISTDEELLLPLKTLLNSALLNWRFKITSTNNHINNYEIDELPIIDLALVTPEIISLDNVNRDIKICSLYGLNKSEADFIIKQYYDNI